MNNNASFSDQIEKAVRAMQDKNGRPISDRNNEIQKIQEIQELVKQKTSEYKAFHSEVEKVVEDNKSLRCALAETIAENERLKNDMPRSIFAMSNELCRIRQELMDLSAERWRLKSENEMLIGELAAIRDMLPDEYGFEEGTVEYAIGYPEGVKDLVKQTLERMQSRVEYNRWLYDSADEYSYELVDLLVKCLPALDESKTDYSELSKEIGAINASFSV